MFKSMLKKEAIETLPVTTMAVTALLCLLDGYGMWEFPWFRDDWVPPWEMCYDFAAVAALFCVAMGLVQSLSESMQGTWGYLLTLPGSRERILMTKLVWGISSLVLCTLIMFAVSTYAVARSNANWASIVWEQQEAIIRCLFTVPIIYFGAFLAGMRPARFYGSRVFPLAGAVLLWFAILYFPNWWLTAIPATLLLCCVLIALIFHEARQRDFA